MATGNAAVSIPISSPPRMLDRSPSNLSSPLSEVEDKDADADDVNFNTQTRQSSPLSHENIEDEDGASVVASRSGSENDDMSNLSEIDINDSEAETERLYDTPPKNIDIRNGPGSSPGSDNQQFTRSGDRPFEPSPSKLKQQLYTRKDPQNDEAGGDLLSDGDNEEDGADGNATDASSEPAARTSVAKERQLPSPLSGRGTRDGQRREVSTIASAPSQSSQTETRKRKRSPAADHSESDQPHRKRIGPVNIADRSLDDDAATATDEDAQAAVDLRNGNRLVGQEGQDGKRLSKDSRNPDSAENDARENARTRKSKRNGIKKQSSSEDGGGDDEEPNGDPLEDTGPGTAEEDTGGQADDDNMEADADEEAEVAHKNEEELERKKAAFEQLQAIEKHFATFRDRLYEDRLSQLNEEEAMLTGDNPTHPEYLAMMQCIDAARDEKMRIIDLEYKFNTQTLKRWAVGRRGQIHGQFFQSVRDSRESVLEELGRQWYQIQQQRRRHANTIPDYGIRFPASKIQRTKEAVAYNKEVSILSGIAKHEGFPAAPQLKGAAAYEIEDDLGEIARARQGSHHHAAIPTSFSSGLSFSLGAAGQQYLADTPWANPNHPSHHAAQRQPEPAPSRQPQQQAAGIFSSSTNSAVAANNTLNGESPPMRLQATAGQENSTMSKAVPEQMAKHEPVVQPS